MFTHKEIYQKLGSFFTVDYNQKYTDTYWIYEFTYTYKIIIFFCFRVGAMFVFVREIFVASKAFTFKYGDEMGIFVTKIKIMAA